MLILGIDTSCASAGAALIESDGAGNYSILGSVAQADKRTHSVKLLPEIQVLTESLGVKTGQIGLICVTSGPGSFTGLRIGASTAKTMAWALGIHVAGVNTLDALADPLPEDGRLVLSMIDARNLRAYGCLYSDGKPAMKPLVDKVSGIVDAIPDGLAVRRIEVRGDVLRNEEVKKILTANEKYEFLTDGGYLYPDPVRVAALGMKAYDAAPDKSAFAPEKLSLDYMKDW